MTKIFVCGMAVIDFIFSVDEMPRLNEKYRAEDARIVGGGPAACAAVAIARLGGEAILATRLGDDMIADLVIADLEKEQVDMSRAHRAEGGRSAFSSVYVNKDGERQIVNFRGSSLTNDIDWLGNLPATDAILADPRWLQGAVKSMEIAHQRGVPGIMDGEVQVDMAMVEKASHVAFSRQGLTELTGEPDITKALKTVSSQIPAWVCVTDGANGVYFVRAEKIENIPAFSVDVADTLAAGDIWHGAFALRLSEGADEPAAIEFANAAAALKCTAQGGRDGCPNRAATEQFIKEYPQWN